MRLLMFISSRTLAALFSSLAAPANSFPLNEASRGFYLRIVALFAVPQQKHQHTFTTKNWR